MAYQFQSAPPVKGATPRRAGSHLDLGVSIRAPREGGDGGSVECLPL